MRIFVAGATGAIGQPLLAKLVRQGHIVTAMTHSETGRQKRRTLGVTVVQVNAFDAPAVTEAIQCSKPEMVIDQLTSLPTHPSAFATAFPADCKLREDQRREPPPSSGGW